MDAEKQERIIRYMVEKITKLQAEEEVFRLFVQELREKDQMVGIQERIHRIRNSQELKDRVAAYFRSLDSLIHGTEELPDRALQELIQRLKLPGDKTN
jgi:uncharacterized protein YdcH (DUF465 family)